MADVTPEKQKPKKLLTIFNADLWDTSHLFELYSNKSDANKEDKSDFISAPFEAQLTDVLSLHTPSEVKCAYTKTCFHLGIPPDPDDIETPRKANAALKEIVLDYHSRQG